MTETLERVWRDALALLTRLYDISLAFARGLDPLAWWLTGGVVALLLLLWLLLRRRDPATGHPEVLLSLGTINASEGLTGGVMLPERFSLRLTVSNLNAYAVQVLELALKTPEMDAPITAEVAAVVPPEGSVVIEEPLPGIAGDEGRLNLYFYAAGSKRLYRVQASFAVEPWNNRYKISPLNQSVTPARQLASASVTRVRERAWRERGREHTEESANLPRPRERTRREDGRERTRDATPEIPRSYPEQLEGPPRPGGTAFPDEF